MVTLDKEVEDILSDLKEIQEMNKKIAQILQDLADSIVIPNEI